MVLHFLILTLPIVPQKMVKPSLAPIKRIAVSFISKPSPPKTMKQDVESPPPEKLKQKVVIPPKPQSEKITTVPEPKPEIKPLVEKKKINQEVARELPKETPVEPLPQKIDPVVETNIQEMEADSAEVETTEEQATTPAANVIQKATPLYKINPPPAYPRPARRRGIEGVVLIKVLVNQSGEVSELELEKSSGHRILDKAALKSVRKWQFTPGNRGGKPIEMLVTVPVHFKLVNN
jgi:protein TonB